MACFFIHMFSRKNILQVFADRFASAKAAKVDIKIY